MRKALVILLGVSLLALFVGSVSARDIDRTGMRMMRSLSDAEQVDQGARGLYTSAALDTYCLVWYDFETMDWQGWQTLDLTAQWDTFFHVDNFSGVTPGDYGLLSPLEGSQSMWCGARPDAGSYYICGWAFAPGYGNGWNQMFFTERVDFTGVLTFQYRGAFDSEPGFDKTFVEYDAGDDNWVEITYWDGRVPDTLVTHELYLAQLATKFRFHFVADGAWSDEDGLWNTDGACILDALSISDGGGPLDYQDFEASSIGDHHAGIWHSAVEDAYGSFAGLRTNLVDKDPCTDDFGTQIIFFDGSDSPSADYPGLFNTPFCTGPGGITSPCQNESFLSPVIDMTMYSTNTDEFQDAAIPAGDLAELRGCILRFQTYRDLPLDNLVFYTWGVRNIIGGCPQTWKDRNLVYYGGDRDYIFGAFDVSDLVSADPLQVNVGVSDMCNDWYDVYGYCSAHTPSPWLDNVRIERYKTTGPQWSVRNIDMFQDNFPHLENDMESTSRIDMANDVLPGENPNILPGDSAVFNCSDKIVGGLDTLVTGEARVYCHAKCTYIGPAPAKPVIEGPSMEGDWGTYLAHVPGGWTTFLCDSALTGAGNWSEDKYCMDFNDDLFTRGYMIEYYFEAFNILGEPSTLPATANEGTYYEVTILPTLSSDVLYVDDFHNRGTFVGTVETYFTPSFYAVLPPTNQPDRYDVNAPSSGLGNGPGARAHQTHLEPYVKMIWDSGNLTSVTIADGTSHSDKGNDAQMLVTWLNSTSHKVGLWVLGDDVAYDLNGSTAPVALTLMSTYCGVQYVADSYYDVTGGFTGGGTVSPLISYVTNPALLFTDAIGPISYYAFGGCPIINQFDVIAPTGNGVACLEYPDYPTPGSKQYAGVYTNSENAGHFPMKTVWMGHSFMYIRDASPTSPNAQNRIFKEVMSFFENETNTDITKSDLPKAYALGQNYPNPFNPNTTIKFSMPNRGHVSLKIYNVAGQLVKTLADEVRDAGVQTFNWDGTNNMGASVASGVYFYKVNSLDYENTKKMILLR